MSFYRIPVIEPFYRGDNELYLKKYGYLSGTILHDLELFEKSSDQEKHDAFIAIYLFSIISVHLDLMGKPTGLDNAKLFKNKIYIITNTIMHNDLLLELSLLYLKIKLLEENKYDINDEFKLEYKSINNILNILDEMMIYIIHMIISYNHYNIDVYINSPNIHELPKLFDTINESIVIDFDLIIKYIDNNINYYFYHFDPDIELNEFGNEIIPLHHDIFYGYYTIIRNFRKYESIKPVNITFSSYNDIVEPNKYIRDIIVKMKLITFKN
jgi:hypothetical protein